MLAHVATVREDQPRVGTRKLHTHLARAGLVVGRDQLFTWLRARNALVTRKRRGTFTTYSKHRYVVAPNRLKDAVITGPGQAVVSDITYLRLARDTFAYLFLTSDVYSRHIVGWHLSRDLSHHSALQALHRAVTTLGAHGDVTGLLHHSDRGSQSRTPSTATTPCACTGASHCGRPRRCFTTRRNPCVVVPHSCRHFLGLDRIAPDCLTCSATAPSVAPSSPKSGIAANSCRV